MAECPCCHDPLRSSPTSHGFVPPLHSNSKLQARTRHDCPRYRADECVHPPPLPFKTSGSDVPCLSKIMRESILIRWEAEYKEKHEVIGKYLSTWMGANILAITGEITWTMHQVQRAATMKNKTPKHQEQDQKNWLIWVGMIVQGELPIPVEKVVRGTQADHVGMRTAEIRVV